MLKFRELIAAGGFVQRANTGPSSFTGVQVSSGFVGSPNMRGIANITSGTTVVSVTATGVVSGDVIITGIIQYPSGVGSQQIVNTYVESVRAGAFEIRTVGSIAPISVMPVGWFRVS